MNINEYILKHKILFFIECILILFSSLLSISLAFIFKYELNIIARGNIKSFITSIYIIILYLLLTFVIKFLLGYVKALYIKNTMLDLKKDTFIKIIKKDIQNFNSDNSGKYISLLSNDIKFIETDLLQNIFLLINLILTFSFSVIALLTINIYMTILILILGLLTFFIPNLLSKKLIKKKTAYSNNLEKFLSIIKDMFSGFEVIKSFNLLHKVYPIFEQSNFDVEESQKEFFIIETFNNCLGEILGYTMFVFIIFFSGYLSIKGFITIGTVFACVQLMNYITSPLMNSISIINKIRSIKNIKIKFNEILLDNTDNKRIKNIKNFSSKIQFKNVNFSYDKKDLSLNNINLEFKKGNKYAIVGESGSGKSTLLKLLLGYYNDYTGSILYDNLELKDINLNDLYNIITVISQSIFIFEASIRENITLFSNYHEEKILNTIKISGLENLLNKLNLDSKINENGKNLSGGEKQRISIARALIKNVPILILDEATSSLDNKTAYEIEQSILKLPNTTCIIVTHRLTKDLLKQYDEIIVMKNGKIIEKGNFMELLKEKKYFYNLYSLTN